MTDALSDTDQRKRIRSSKPEREFLRNPILPVAVSEQPLSKGTPPAAHMDRPNTVSGITLFACGWFSA